MGREETPNKKKVVWHNKTIKHPSWQCIFINELCQEPRNCSEPHHKAIREECQIGISLHTTRQLACPMQLRCGSGFCIFSEAGKHQTALAYNRSTCLSDTEIDQDKFICLQFCVQCQTELLLKWRKKTKRKIPGQVNLWSDCGACHYIENMAFLISLFFLGKCFYLAVILCSLL